MRRPEPVASLSSLLMDSSQVLSRAFALVLTNSKRTGVGRIVGKPDVIQKGLLGSCRTLQHKEFKLALMELFPTSLR